MERRQFVTRMAGGAALAVCGIDGRIEQALGRIARVGNQRAAAPATPPYHMLVFGDSIAWGQGLRDDEKFSTLVQQWLAHRFGGRTVVKWTFAHSGAVLGTDAQDNHPPLPPEVPVNYPSVMAQLASSPAILAHHPFIDVEHAAPVSPADVSLVLVNGGINDVNVRNILTSDPTITDAESWIRGLARHRCVERMRDELLPRLLAAYPNALVIVTGYYAIVSEDTRLGDLEALLDELGLLGSLGSLGVTALIRGKLAGQCAAFADETAVGLAEVVPKAQPLQVIASASTSPKEARTRLGVASLQGGTEPTHPARAHFVDARLAPEESFGASQTKLWGIPASDPMASIRQHDCERLGATVGYLTCLEASAGHPNRAGAQLLADRIIARRDLLGLDAGALHALHRSDTAVDQVCPAIHDEQCRWLRAVDAKRRTAGGSQKEDFRAAGRAERDVGGRAPLGSPGASDSDRNDQRPDEAAGSSQAGEPHSHVR